jgi:hypothetical protein
MVVNITDIAMAVAKTTGRLDRQKREGKIADYWVRVDSYGQIESYVLPKKTLPCWTAEKADIMEQPLSAAARADVVAAATGFLESLHLPPAVTGQVDPATGDMSFEWQVPA